MALKLLKLYEDFICVFEKIPKFTRGVMKQKIVIISNYSTQNKMLGDYLRQRTLVEISFKEYQGLETITIPNHNYQKTLFLFDWLRNDKEVLWNAFETTTLTNKNNTFFAIFNLENNEKIIKDALYGGIRGVFFEKDSIELITKGIASIFNGELWFTRKLLEKCLSESSNFRIKTIRFNNDKLTLREREILSLIVAGQNNHEIAETLGVSVYTVKTHVYKIFQKIHVSSRLKASIWAVHNASVETFIDDSQKKDFKQLKQ